MSERTYVAIDLKSFYASAECLDRNLDPLTTNLLVADEGRTEKTVCLAVSPSLKVYGIGGRSRLFEAVERIKQANALRLQKAPNRKFTGSSCNAAELQENPSLSIDYIVAKPRMAHYMECSAKIYQIYLKYVAPEDIHVYSIDEVFIDATAYLSLHGCTPMEFAKNVVSDVFTTTGITATAGIGTNLYLCKIAMDIVAKRTPASENGVCIAALNEQSYREMLWSHRPLTDFWRLGKGCAKKLETHGIFTMGDIARCSLENEELLYKLFGVNAEFLVDHAWGWEPCTISDIKAYQPDVKSINSGQILHLPYDFQKTKLVLREMAEALVLELVAKGLTTEQIVLTVGYDRVNSTDKSYVGEVTADAYGRQIPKPAHGTVTLKRRTSSSALITKAVMELYDKIVEKGLLIRRISVTFGRVLPENAEKEEFSQMDLFGEEAEKERQKVWIEREKRRQQAVLAIKKKYGKNAIFKAMSLQEGATALERNRQIGGHNA